MTIAEVIGCNLRGILQKKNKSVMWLVDRSGVSRSTIFRIMSGGVLPTQANIEEICFALNINETDLIKIDSK